MGRTLQEKITQSCWIENIDSTLSFSVFFQENQGGKKGVDPNATCSLVRFRVTT